MTMFVGKRKIEAKIKKKEEAREDYETAKAEGKSASLLEQERPNVFSMNVANIRPGDTIKVELKYNELISPEEGVYEFVYPTVAGPRYEGSGGTDKDPWVTNPYTHEDTHKYMSNTYTFDIDVELEAPLPISAAQCSSHEVNINYKSERNAIIGLKKMKSNGGEKDFIFRYSLSGNEPETGLTAYKGKDGNYFLFTVQPPKRLEKDKIPPREYIFIMDVSGSMSGFPIELSKNMMRKLLSGLKPHDRFNLMLFAGSSEIMANESVAATKANIDRAMDIIDGQNGRGSTEVLSALEKALSMKNTRDYSRSFIILTDGYVTVEKECFDLIRENLGNANFFSIGIGENVNRFIIEGMAHVGNTDPIVVTSESRAREAFLKFTKLVSGPVLTNIELDFGGFDAYDLNLQKVPDLFAEKPVVIFGKWKGPLQGEIRLKGRSGNGIFRAVHRVTPEDMSKESSVLKYLWARDKIRILSDYNSIDNDEDLVEEITDLGLKYNLLTDYTSFIAVDHKRKNSINDDLDMSFKATDSQKPVSISSKYSGGSSGAVPEPEEWLLIIALSLTAIFVAYRKFFA